MVWSFTSASQQVTFWVVSISPSQWGQTAEMSPPVASERVSVVVTWLGSLLMRFFVTELLVGNIGNSFVPKSQSSLLSLLIKFQVDGDDDDGFFNGETTTPMFVSHIFGPFPASVFLAGSFINIPTKPSSNYPTYGICVPKTQRSLGGTTSTFSFACLATGPIASSQRSCGTMAESIWMCCFFVWLPWIAQLPVRAFQQFTIPSPAHQLIHSNCHIGSVNLFNWEIEWVCRILYNVLFL